MNEKNLPENIASKTLNELTDLADKIIKNLENENNLENTSDDYVKLLKINKIIEKKFQKNLKEISDKTNSKIKNIISDINYISNFNSNEIDKQNKIIDYNTELAETNEENMFKNRLRIKKILD